MRGLQEIELDIQRAYKALYRAVGNFDTTDPVAWQWAIDRRPDMHAHRMALNAEYVEAMWDRDARRQAKFKARNRRRQQEAFRAARAARRCAALYQLAA